MNGLKGLVLLALGMSSPAWAQSWQQQPQGAQSIGQVCPMYVSGTQVEMIDINGQMQLAFRTDSDVREVQRRTAAFADALVTPNQQQSESGHGGPMSLMSKGPMAICSEVMGLQQASLRGRPMVDNMRDGARIVFQAQDPNEAAALRARLHLLAAQLVSGQCPQSAVGLLAPNQQGGQWDEQQEQQREQWREQQQQQPPQR